jgi:hypothetical protein
MKMLEDDRVSVDADAVRGALDDVIAMIPATAPALRPIGVIGGDVPALSGHIVLLGDVALAPYFMPALRHRHRPGQGQGQSGPAMVAMHPDSKLIKRTSDALAQWTGAYAVVGSPRVREDLLDRAQLASAVCCLHLLARAWLLMHGHQ